MDSMLAAMRLFLASLNLATPFESLARGVIDALVL
jgi:hypothetical protein